MILARRVLEAGRTVVKEELLEPPNESRNWSQELREAGLEKVWQLEHLA